MTKLLSALTAFAMVCALGTGAAFAKDKNANTGTMKTTKTASSKASTMGKTMSAQCAPGKKYVKPYTKKNGTKVKGYCR